MWLAVTWNQAALVTVGFVTAFIGGSLGAILSTWLLARHQRDEAWRDRQSIAADAFASRVTLAIPAIRDAYHPSVTAEKLEALIELTDDAHAHVARIVLVFEPNSETADEARLTIGDLREAIKALRADTPDAAAAERRMHAADSQLRRFAAHAHAVMRDTTFIEPPATPAPPADDDQVVPESVPD